MTSFEKKGTYYNLASLSVDIEDTSYRSNRYFCISDLPSTFTAGKNYFTINGIGNLKKNSQIFIEILDSKGRPLHYEIGKKDNFVYTNADATIISPYVYKSSTEWGSGKIYIVGTTIDNKKVRWSTNIKINPNVENVSPVIFYDTPKLNMSEELSLIIKSSALINQKTLTISGSFNGYSVYPKVYSIFTNVDVNDIANYDYRLRYNDISSISDNNLFTTNNIGTEITLNVNKIGYLSPNGILQTQSVNVTKSFYIDDVVNNYEISTKTPFVYTINGYPQICTIIESQFNNTFTSIPYITQSIYSGNNNDPNGDYNPNLYKCSYNSGETVFYKTGYLNLTLTNLRTLSGKPHRYKIYKKSLNESAEFSIAGDGKLDSVELLYDDFGVNNFYGNIGTFYTQFHIDKYYYSYCDTGTILLSHSSENVLNSMYFYASDDINENSSVYIIVKKYTSIQTSESYGNVYIDYDEEEFNKKRGKSYDSNFIQLYPNVNYSFECGLDLLESINNSKDAKLEFYLTGSFNVNMNDGDKNYVPDRGLKLSEYILPKNKSNVYIFKKDSVNIFSTVNEYRGTLVIIPTNLKRFRISNVSLKSYTEFGFSPDLFTAKIPFTVNTPNEAHEYTVELLDFNSNTTNDEINKLVRLDKTGESTYGLDFDSYNETDPHFMSSPAVELSNNHITFLKYHVVNNTASFSHNCISASYSLNGSYSMTSSYSLNGSYSMTSSYSLNGSYSMTSSYSDESLSSSYLNTLYDIEIANHSSGLILTAPNNSKWRLSINNTGTASWTQVV